MSLHTQLVTMGVMIVGGIYIGIAKDTFQRFSPLWYHSTILKYSLEVLFWLLQTFFLYYVLYKMNYGEIRLYFFIAIAFGFSIYIVFFQTIYKKMLNWFIRIIVKMLTILYKLCITPIIYISKLILKILLFILRLIVKFIQKLYDYIIHPLIKFILPKKVYNFSTKIAVTCSTMIDTLYNKVITFLRKIRR